MIRYTLTCSEDHSFDSWFQSSSSFDDLKARGLVECPVCGSQDVQKGLMTPRVTASRAKGAPAEKTDDTRQPVVSAPTPEMQQALAEMKRQVEANSDYVGDKFANEARAMHLGDAPERSIYGQANAQEAKALIEDGVPVMPLPFTPTKQTN